MNKFKNTDALIIFAKLPEPGKVKTRLANGLGEDKAAELYSILARDIISRTSKSTKYETALFFDPPGKKNQVYEWLREISQIDKDSLIPQDGDSLGDRISNAFERVFSNGAKKAVIIGTDCIGVNTEIIEKTLIDLNDYDSVIGPAVDGGYYLLALTRHIPELFQNIDWSTGRVFEQTLERINNQNLIYKLLEPLSDIDEMSDLKDLPPEFNFK